ncbi:hypothetical protein HMPREF9073_00477 [Capnocytophaga sp. oral taxon 326 str. F0382]|nr:hypothetical protein HMPREF9073_00477 [Capnocytophaga sp. oral taxon 326 str. F0382]
MSAKIIIIFELQTHWIEKSEEYFIVWNIHLDIFKVQVVEYTHFIEDKNTSRKDKISWRYFL